MSRQFASSVVRFLGLKHHQIVSDEAGGASSEPSLVVEVSPLHLQYSSYSVG
jgi:hypothetical protein